MTVRFSPARPLPHLALGGVHVAVGATNRAVPRPGPFGAALGALVLVRRLLGAGAVMGEGYSVPVKEGLFEQSVHNAYLQGPRCGQEFMRRQGGHF